MAIPFRLRLGLTIAGTAVVAGLVALGSWAWQRRLPSEVQTLQAVVERLSRSNDLGRQPIIFMMGSGEYSSFLAQQRGLCKPDQCEMFNQLNPYKHYGNGWDELTRQGYALSSIQAWTTPAGTVVLPRSTFRAYGPRIGYLACTVAHEIAHFRRNHGFIINYQENHKFKSLDKQKKQLAVKSLSRQHELEADRDSAEMMARAGYKGRICQQGMEFLHRSNGDGSATEPDFTHPGYEERMKAIRQHYDALEKKPVKPQRSTSGSFRFDAADSLLTFSPKP